MPPPVFVYVEWVVAWTEAAAYPTLAYTSERRSTPRALAVDVRMLYVERYRDIHSERERNLFVLQMSCRDVVLFGSRVYVRFSGRIFRRGV